MATRLENWGEILRTQNLSPERPMDAVSRWLLIVRASVFPMTIVSGAIGGLLAFGGPDAADADALHFLAALLGIVLAHAANNMINDYFDLESGVDSDQYVRGQYAPHPILSGLVSKRGLLAAIAFVNLLDLGILAYLASVHGWPIVAFALLGLFVSVFYVAPPLLLKHRGLGEPGVFLVWGPFMVGGTYLATTGHVEPWVIAASLPYGLLVMAVLMGKHVDKLEADTAKGIHTLPVLLGETQARFVTQALIGGFFVLVPTLVLTGTLSIWTLLSFLALRRAGRVLATLSRPKPAAPPPDVNVPIWPLWFVGWVFVLTRLAGGLFVLGLALDLLVPLHL
jgi:1,4-dihydroxy-2-naphthoate octaprenyltransferase